MAKKITVFEMADGTKIGVEIEVSPGEQERIANVSEDFIENAQIKFGDSLESVQRATAQILNGFRSNLEPDELEVAFGLKFSAKAGAILASTDAEATLTLKAKWQNHRT